MKFIDSISIMDARGAKEWTGGKDILELIDARDMQTRVFNHYITRHVSIPVATVYFIRAFIMHFLNIVKLC